MSITKFGKQNEVCVKECCEVLVNLTACYLSLHTALNDKRNVNLVDITVILLIMFFYNHKCYKM